MTASPAPKGHAPVMAAEVVAALAPKAGEVFVDGTFGGGGYSLALLDAADCKVYGIDRDPDAIARGRALEARFKGRLVLLEGCFSEMDSLLEAAGEDKVDGVALDLGVSSFQLDEPSRGFSFLRDGALDMRMSKAGLSAAEVVNTFSERQLADIFFAFGEEKKSRRIAKKIVAARAVKPIATTAELSALVCKALGAKTSRGASALHPATRVFQALRIFVNRELDELERGLAAAERILREGGRLAVVSFHSLEDRIVKTFLKQRSGNIPQGSRHSPPDATPGKWREPTLFLPLKKAQTPGEAEIEANPRARSAKLRVAVRTAASSAEA
jgi:16S rRNA (cytosine1402-N4)-methyltransferase